MREKERSEGRRTMEERTRNKIIPRPSERAQGSS